MKRILFIVNKTAGTEGKKAFPSRVKHVLDSRRYVYDIAYTEFPGHAVTLAAEAAKSGTEIVAAVGGDGSVNEAARGLLGTQATLAVIPRGSGNGLARSLGIPLYPEKALAMINRSDERLIDAGFANGRLFLSNAGVGFDALIARRFAGNAGRGLLNYSGLVLQAMRKYRPGHYHLVTDAGEIHEQAFFVAAANGNQFGYNFKIVPDARPDDGLLDICLVRPLRWRHLPAVSLKSLSGKLADSRFAKHLRCRAATITSDEELTWMQADGDAWPVTGGKVQVSVRPGALKILAPRQA